MEASPGSALEVIEAQFAFHLLVVALDAPSQFREANQSTRADIVLGRFESQNLVGFDSPSNH